MGGWRPGQESVYAGSGYTGAVVQVLRGLNETVWPKRCRPGCRRAALHGGDGSCQRGMMVRGIVVIDIRQCRSGGGNDVGSSVTATDGKMPRQ